MTGGCLCFTSTELDPLSTYDMVGADDRVMLAAVEEWRATPPTDTAS